MYKITNGHPNRYFGWGLEDHDEAFRLRNAKIDETIGEDIMSKYKKVIKISDDSMCDLVL